MQTEIVSSSLFASLQILSRSGFNEFSIPKIKEAEFFNELTIHSRFVVFASLQTEIVASGVFAFLQILSRSVFVLEFSIQKIKEAEFFNELTIHGSFVVFAFLRTDIVTSSLFAFLQIIIEKRFCY